MVSALRSCCILFPCICLPFPGYVTRSCTRLRLRLRSYVLVCTRSWSPGSGYVTHVHRYILHPWFWYMYILYTPNTIGIRYYICNQKIFTMTSTHDTTIEMLNDLYLIVAGTDLSNSKINKTAIFAYLYQQIELQENLAEIEMDYWNSRD